MAALTMSIQSKVILLIGLLLTSTLCIAEPLLPRLGVAATQQANNPQWQLTIFPDGTGLPEGQGNAAQGEQIFAQKCAGCHGPGGRGASALALTGDVGSLSSNYPEKTVNSYWPYATTLFDYIRRAMPINAPYSLSSNDIYALCAYILSQDDIIPAGVTMDKLTLPQVMMPNRDGFSTIDSK